MKRSELMNKKHPHRFRVVELDMQTKLMSQSYGARNTERQLSWTIGIQ